MEKYVKNSLKIMRMILKKTFKDEWQCFCTCYDKCVWGTCNDKNNNRMEKVTM